MDLQTPNNPKLFFPGSLTRASGWLGWLGWLAGAGALHLFWENCLPTEVFLVQTLYVCTCSFFLFDRLGFCLSAPSGYTPNRGGYERMHMRDTCVTLAPPGPGAWGTPRQIFYWPWAMSHKPWVMSHEPWVMSHEPWDMSHKPRAEKMPRMNR